MSAILFWIAVGAIIGLALGEGARLVGYWLGRRSITVTDEPDVTGDWRWPER